MLVTCSPKNQLCPSPCRLPFLTPFPRGCFREVALLNGTLNGGEPCLILGQTHNHLPNWTLVMPGPQLCRCEDWILQHLPLMLVNSDRWSRGTHSPERGTCLVDGPTAVNIL